ncbi:hypothetical protein J5N97_007349 [Dioscorea zingiberensis]|uniref:Protein kinase domain-containing protein n=1 Tax=Dioscorea zingiberensis TaxID=325984 RepID=A0A9D5DBL3_9LILI|nr:hypothetical protein J5N97_007349 [Dioscorea zingiberensis]
MANHVSVVLVRPTFVYKNHDLRNRPPSFGLSLGTAIAAFVNLTVSDPWVEEVILRIRKRTVVFCLLSTPHGGFPVISSIEVRPLPDGAYGAGLNGDRRNHLLRKRFRINCGYNGSEPLRYPYDPYDRLWDADRYFSPTRLSAGFHIEVPINVSGLRESPPIAVLQTVRVLARKNVLAYNLSLGSPGDYLVVLYFAGILPVSSSFDILVNADMVRSSYRVNHAEAGVILHLAKSVDSLNIMFRNITFYPQVNAFEVYEIVEIPQEVSATTVSALQVIQQSTGFDLGWQDDPCSPLPWKHLECNGSLVTSLALFNMDLGAIYSTFGDLLDLRALDLHNTSLTGEIMNLGSLQRLETLNLSFNKLTSFGSGINTMISLQILDLQNNNLEGAVPDSLGSLKNLHLLNLENNKLEGILPQSLNKESLEVRTSGNLCLSFTFSTCNNLSDHPSIQTPQFTVVNIPKHSNHIKKEKILGVIGVLCCMIILILVAIFKYKRRKRTDGTVITSSAWTTTEMRSWDATKIFTYKEIKVATNNFNDVIGSGGFGKIYLGKLSDGKLVAVKVRSDRTQLGADSFVNEVRLLTQVRHPNLVTLEGFCHESEQQILVYEYLPGRSLADNLYGSNSKKATLNWACRLKIAVDAAKGLDYLHNGSTPRIIHRDVKSSNILLDMEFNAKVGDFGLSKQVPQASASHVTTAVKGTAGYLDPEYYSTLQLTEKSDVYSFGIVLLELICGREPLSHAGPPDTYNLVLWAKPYLQAGAFEIVDESIKGAFDVESMRKAASIAVKCVDRDASGRPTIAQVLAELKEAYTIQLTSSSSGGHLL